ncbi:MAG TPA: hypothetical protein VI522_02340, partial [Gammaproteobacteria bacterium]|nr:hypothetical protein [Gammaproteobacteria bacterium]
MRNNNNPDTEMTGMAADNSNNSAQQSNNISSYPRSRYAFMLATNASTSVSAVPLNLGLNVSQRLGPVFQKVSLFSIYCQMVMNTLTSSILSSASTQVTLSQVMWHNYTNGGNQGGLNNDLDNPDLGSRPSSTSSNNSNISSGDGATLPQAKK